MERPVRPPRRERPGRPPVAIVWRVAGLVGGQVEADDVAGGGPAGARARPADDVVRRRDDERRGRRRSPGRSGGRGTGGCRARDLGRTARADGCGTMASYDRRRTVRHRPEFRRDRHRRRMSATGGSHAGPMSVPRRLVPGLAALPFALLAVLVVAGCSYVETVPLRRRPARLPGDRQRARRRRHQDRHVVSGDAGCTDQVLAPTARSFDARAWTRDDRPDLPVHVRRPGDLSSACARRSTLARSSFVTDPETYESVEQSPFVLAGQGPWGTAFEAALARGPGRRRRIGRRAGSDDPRPRIRRAMTSRWTWLVPSPISVSLASRR